MKAKIQSTIRAGKISLAGIASLYGVDLSYVEQVFQEMVMEE